MIDEKQKITTMIYGKSYTEQLFDKIKELEVRVNDLEKTINLKE